ncbi:MAG: hypothetical protein CO189_12390 [candidate division Zixibacteria bacterium CG_4_9_14_3_um_filter_46_8]|nr:MAG: hypothetical protein CO189_12390 [candidate division Zixibacteria bacterium CG_4_9_14_3_um_filter_46_8]
MRFRVVFCLLASILFIGAAQAAYLEAGKEYVPNKIVVNFQPEVGILPIDNSSGKTLTGIAEIDQLNRDFSAFDMHRLFPGSKDEELKYYYVIRFADAPELEELLASYNALSIIEHVESVGIQPIYVVPNDPSYGTQWHLPKVSAPQAWDLEQGDAAVIIGIPDTGVDLDHPDLANHIWINDSEDINHNHQFDGGDIDNIDNDGNGYIDDVVGWDWVDNAGWLCTDADCDTPDNNPMDYMGHGSHCSGIASAVTNNGAGVAGLDWNGTIMPLRIGYQLLFVSGVVQMDWAASAINYATNKGVRVISCSWGSDNSGGIAAAVDNAVAHGVLLFSAAGNDNNQTASYLCNRSDVVAVAATNSSDQKASFSNFGTWVDVCAPGENIYSTLFDNTYANMSGTSMASPLAAGLAGLVTSQNPSLTPAQVAQRIYDSCDNIDPINPSYAGLLGYGRIDAYSAVAGGSPGPGVSVSMIPDNPPINIPAGGSFTFTGVLTNNTSSPTITDVWVKVLVPGYGLYGPVLQANNVPLSANQTLTYPGINQNIPSFAPIGQYAYIAYCGNYPSPIDSSYFTFNVTAGALGKSADWSLNGWFGDCHQTLPMRTALTGIFPNPFNTKVVISYDLAYDGLVSLEVYNLMGQKVGTLVDGFQSAGHKVMRWDASEQSSGVYFARLALGQWSAVSRMTLMK